MPPDDIWAIVERCRRDTTKLPKDEPCRFCGNICNSWKKLTVHLAKHMEQISMPILPLVEQKVLNADTIISPVQELPDARKLSAALTRKPVNSNSPLHQSPNTTFAPGITPFGQVPQNNSTEAAANVMHSYPPPEMVPTQQSGYAGYAANNVHYSNQTYPGLQNPPKSPMVYNNGFQMQNPMYLNMGPMSAVQQQEQAMFTNSPTETTAFPSYFTPDQQMTEGYDSTMQMQYQQQAPTGTYQAMQYLTNQQQHNYQYQG